MPEKIVYKTDDDVMIVGDWVTSPTTMGAVILLHALPDRRQSWAVFQQKLAHRGLASLAIDLRGHGESTRGPEGSVVDYTKFGEDAHVSSMFDVRGAYAWIRTRGIERDLIMPVGASIGANLALLFLSEEPQVPAAGLLSPGEEYHGVNALEVAELVLPHQAVWMAASVNDDKYSAESCDTLMAALEVETKIYERLENAGHGMKLFENHQELMGKLADWLRDRILAI
jgi:alpha-beta hydrolase superfamily lysophospholipase